MSDRLIAIGDVHGCSLALQALLEAIAPGPTDIVVMLGDYVDRGPDSRGVVDSLIDLAQQTRLVCLMGNHEEMMLAVLKHGEPHHGWLRHGGVETLESYRFNGDLDFLPPAHDRFYESLGDYFETDDFFFTHAAYDPQADLQHQPPEMLRWHSLRDGVPGPHRNGKLAVVGHTANRDGEVLDVGHLLCIDTCCYGGGWLTAIDLQNRTLWQADKEGKLRAGMRA